MKYHLLVHPELGKQMGELSKAAKADPGSEAAKEYNAAMKALSALRDGRETDYPGSKQLAFGRSSHDLRDCAELKVPVVAEYDGNRRLGPSHRLIYREFEPLRQLEGTRMVPDKEGLPFRQAIAFERKSVDPPEVAGDRLGRARGMAEQDLVHMDNKQVAEGPAAAGAQITPNRIAVPPELEPAAAAVRARDLELLKEIQKDSPPPGTAPPGDQPAGTSRPGTPGDVARRAGPGNIPRPGPPRPQSPER